MRPIVSNNKLAELSLSLPPLPPCAGESGCEAGMESWDGYCYFFGVAMVTRDEALAACDDLAANLVYVQSMDEHNFLKAQIASLDVSLDFWIGKRCKQLKLYL